MPIRLSKAKPVFEANQSKDRIHRLWGAAGNTVAAFLLTTIVSGLAVASDQGSGGMGQGGSGGRAPVACGGVLARQREVEVGPELR